MKKKIFKYRAIGIVLFIIEVFLGLLFGYGTIVSFEDLQNGKILSLDNVILPFAALISITAILCIISIILKGIKTILFFNIHYIIVGIFFAFGFIKQLFEGAEVSEDIEKFIIVFFVLSILLFTINFFKYKETEFLEIDEIGN